jgi:dihydroorotate dehydrogenase electron transfer subunit
MAKFQEKCRVSAFEQLTADIFRLSVHGPRIAAVATPGQFVMVAVSDSLDPLLRRPLSIHRRSSDGSIGLLFKVIGKGTEMLTHLRVGDTLDLIGPLGRGFDLAPAGPVCLIGGGMGIAPLYFLAGQLARGGRNPQDDHVLLGARNREEIGPLADEFRALGYPVQVATDDGSIGHHGLIPELLPARLPAARRVYACGPHPMMKAVAGQCRQADVSCQVSLETHMACGLGACLGCAVSGAGGNYVHVCQHGPVFNAGDIAW